MVQQSGDITLDSALEIWRKENEVAKTPVERNQALARFKKSLQNAKATDSGADLVLKFLDQVQGKEIEGMQKILELRDRQIQKKQDLQAQQASLQMDISSGPEKARSGMYSMAAGFASFLRIVGKWIPAANGLADTLEESVAEWKPKVALDTRGISSGAEFKTSLDQVLRELKASGTSAELAQKGVERVSGVHVAPIIASGDIPGVAGASPASPASPSASPQKAAGKAGWATFKANLISLGLTEADADKVMPSWHKSASTSGEKDALELGEVAAFKIRLNGVDLTDDKKALVKKALDKSKGPVEALAEAGPR